MINSFYLNTLVINNNSGTTVQTITADNVFLEKTIGNVLNELVTNGYMTSADINNGVISLSSNDNNYITGTIAEKFGIGVQTEGTTYTNNGVTVTTGFDHVKE